MTAYKFSRRDVFLFPFGLGKLYKQMFQGVKPLDWMELFAHLFTISLISDFLYSGNLSVFLMLLIPGLLLFDCIWLFKWKFKSSRDFKKGKDYVHWLVAIFFPLPAFIVFMLGDIVLSFAILAAGFSHFIIDAIFRRLQK